MIVASVSPARAPIVCGAVGMDAGMPEIGAVNGLSPIALVAATRKRYDVPFTNPVTICDVPAIPDAAVAHETPSTDRSTRYPEIEPPPFDDVGVAVQPTVT